MYSSLSAAEAERRPRNQARLRATGNRVVPRGRDVRSVDADP
jgi:hypothetical protein